MRHSLLFAVLALVAGLSTGACSMRRPARTATSGAIEAFAPPGEEEQFKQDVRDLAQKLVESAMQDPPDPAEVARDTGRGFVQGAFLTLSEPRWRARVSDLLDDEVPQALRQASSEMAEASVRGGVTSLLAREEDLAAFAAFIASRASEAATSAAFRRIDQELGARSAGSPRDRAALEGVFERAAAASIRGAMGELGSGLSACQDPNDPRCRRQVVSGLSRSATSGALQSAALTALLVLAAFAVGAVAALAATRLASHRRARPA